MGAPPAARRRRLARHVSRELPAGTYGLRVEADGYAPKTVGIRLEPARVSVVDVVLEPRRRGR